MERKIQIQIIRMLFFRNDLFEKIDVKGLPINFQLVKNDIHKYYQTSSFLKLLKSHGLILGDDIKIEAESEVNNYEIRNIIQNGENEKFENLMNDSYDPNQMITKDLFYGSKIKIPIIHYSIMCHSIKIFQSLLLKGSNPLYVIGADYTCFWSCKGIAAAFGEEKILKILLDYDSLFGFNWEIVEAYTLTYRNKLMSHYLFESDNKIDKKSLFKILMYAIMSNNLEGFNTIINLKYLESPDLQDGLILFKESMKNQNKTVYDLLKSGSIRTSVYDFRKNTLIHFAAYHNSIEAGKILIDLGGNHNENNLNNYSPLHVAARFDSKEIGKLLIKAGAVIDQKVIEDDISTPLCVATRNNSVRIAEELIKSGANLQIKVGKLNLQLLHIAAGEGSIEVAKLLMNYGLDSNCMCISKWRPIHWAVLKNHFDFTKLLIDNGAAINCFNDNSSFPLEIAAKHNFIEICRLLVESGAIVNCKNNDKKTPLHIALEKNFKEIAHIFKPKWDIHNFHNNEESTPLHIAAQYNSIEIGENWIQSGDDVNAKDKCGSTPLHSACIAGSKEFVELLIRSGANVNVQNNSGYSPFDQSKNQNDILEILINSGLDVNQKNNNGDTPIYKAIGNNSAHIVKLLIEKGANVNTRNEDNFTPLHFNRIKGQKEISEILLEAGADPNLDVVDSGKCCSVA